MTVWGCTLKREGLLAGADTPKQPKTSRTGVLVRFWLLVRHSWIPNCFRVTKMAACLLTAVAAHCQHIRPRSVMLCAVGKRTGARLLLRKGKYFRNGKHVCDKREPTGCEPTRGEISRGKHRRRPRAPRHQEIEKEHSALLFALLVSRSHHFLSRRLCAP